jgi:hypothetical protein
VFLCPPYRDDSLCVGSLKEQTLEEIWKSPRREFVVKKMKVTDECYRGCRYHEMNKYLYSLLIKEDEHYNFI